MNEDRKIEDFLNIAEYVAILKRRWLSSYYSPYLSWGFYLLINTILTVFFHFYLGWALLWIPAAFFNCLSYTKFKVALYSWIIAGVIFYVLLFFFKWYGFYISIPLASLLGFGILPSIFGKKSFKQQKKDLLQESIGMYIFIIIICIVALFFVLRVWINPFSICYPWIIMVTLFYGLKGSFLRSKIFLIWVFVILASIFFVAIYNPKLWYIPGLITSISAIHIGFYGLSIRKKVKMS